ncbi:Mitochondrial AAA ATPase [Aspergillus sclerotialis]|uniref:Mitochondrial AAA ATPase n=1 Tax=Aspergillus sclerotialis TaxID=2070753 RepID=A0A3A2Z6J7_9EURO|nr:Mitochondrial AAA ATPase [Aspergillus sclerotialis]
MYRTIHPGKLLRPCRFIANRRYPAITIPSRPISSTRWFLSQTSDPNGARSSAPKDAANSNTTPLNNAEQSISQNENAPATAPPMERLGDSRELRPYGSAVRRAMRNLKPAESAPPVDAIPDWFYERNLRLHKSEGQEAAQMQKQVWISPSEVEVSGSEAEPESGAPSQPEKRYILPSSIWQELVPSAKAGMLLPPAKYANEPSAKRSHLVLQYPGDDGILFLDAVVKRLAQELEVDLVTINAQDIARLCTEYDLADRGVTSPIRSLSYEIYRPPTPEDLGSGDAEPAENEESSGLPIPRGYISPAFITSASRPRLKTILAKLDGRLDDVQGIRNNARRAENDWTHLANEIVASSSKSAQRATKLESPTGVEASNTRQAQRRGVIIQVQDYEDIRSSPEGSKFITFLHQAIHDRRKDGSPVMLIGTVSEDTSSMDSLDPFLGSDDADEDPLAKTLVVVPHTAPGQAPRAFIEDQRNRTMDINIGHLQEMLRTRLSEQSLTIEPGILNRRDWPFASDPEVLEKTEIASRYWTYDQVHWAVTLSLGCVDANETFGFEHIRRGITLMNRTNDAKNVWLQGKESSNKQQQTGNKKEQLSNSLRQSCNKYEKKLLNGVVDAQSIRTTFSDVHVPSDTVEALKTLTSLSLIRPEAFTYGVLATDKIPGLLLYGPPGTGKTLLAKAVAKESGATVLEVSGSDIYDMFVGEGEKNVKAIFTLAKKLSPCVVFIDEADSIFRSRAGGGRRSNRELINQFLREWDGMNDLSAFIMVATNRPFDLDDAVLRRLPRRLLVDLPTEQDRTAILKIHLKDEALDPSVDLAELARRTPLYSGSDLKNLSVAAALACVREENAMAAQHTGEEPYKYPERRTLTKAHFERGMEEISASINEDMSSLTAIKKFDEQYGDRKGRRKKSPGWGFVPPGGDETREETARVRS